MRNPTFAEVSIIYYPSRDLKFYRVKFFVEPVGGSLNFQIFIDEDKQIKASHRLVEKETERDILRVFKVL